MSSRMLTSYTTAALLFGGCCSSSSIITAASANNAARHAPRVNDATSHRTLQTNNNDACGDSTVIASLPYQVTNTTIGSSGGFDIASCGAVPNTDRNGLWYTYTSSETKELTISVNSGLAVRVYSGECSNLACVSQSDVMHSFVGLSNIQYRFLVSSPTDVYDFVLNVDEAPVPTDKPTSDPTTANPTPSPTSGTSTITMQPSKDVGNMDTPSNGESNALKEPLLRQVSGSPTFETMDTSVQGYTPEDHDSSADGSSKTRSAKGGKGGDYSYSMSMDCIDEDEDYSMSYRGGKSSGSSYGYASSKISKAFKSKKPKRNPTFGEVSSMSYMTKSGKADSSMSYHYEKMSTKAEKSSKKRSKCSAKSIKGKMSKSVHGKMSKNDEMYNNGLQSQLDNARYRMSSAAVSDRNNFYGLGGGVVVLLMSWMMGTL